MNHKLKILIVSLFSVVISITTVYAVTLIQASDVIYDNSKSGGSSNNVQGAIDELYGISANGGSSGSATSSKNIIKYITNLAKTDTINLAYDDTSDKNLRYIGSNPNNYVEFNGELWRIIGVMNNVEDESGTKASRVKLVRNESVDNSWSTISTGYPYGSNDWTTSSLKTLLNSGAYYNRTGAYSNTGLMSDSKAMIDNINWNLGGISSPSETANKLYQLERGKTVYSGRQTTWKGNVGLMYPSDYGYAVGNENRALCLSKNLDTYNSDSCNNNNWLSHKSTNHEWLLSSNSISNYLVYLVADQGYLTNGQPRIALSVHPVVYLNPELYISEGKGTEANPYKLTTKYVSVDESNASPPKIDDEEKLKPVKLADDGTVTFVSQDDEEWYNYSEKKWANAVILVDSPSKTYKVGDTIKESDIESYFVWIPKYKYRLWNTGTAIKNVHEIDIVFDTKDTTDIEGKSCKTPMTSGATGNCNNGEYMTHPAFISLGVDGFWVGKFETGYKGATSTALAQVNSSDSSKIIIKPNVYSWRGNTVYNFFTSAYNYERTLDSHMMKNTEWGAVAYLSHSKYGINHEININNNSSYKTGYSALPSTSQQIIPGDFGDGEKYNQAYNTSIGYLASTTGNTSGVYDMNGGSLESVSAYLYGSPGSSGFTTETLASYENKYFDIYNESSSINTYQYRILGDATGEMGPFKQYLDGDNTSRWHSSWYSDISYFINPTGSWVVRGGHSQYGALSGSFSFYISNGITSPTNSSRIVLTG